VDDPTAGQAAADTVARFWNERHQDATGEAHDNYLNHPLIQAYISLRALGGLVSHLEAAIHAIRGRTRPGDVILSLGCGTAAKERVLAAALPDRVFIGTDIAGEIVDRANDEIKAQGLGNLTVVKGDFNRLDLEPDSLQVLLGLGAIHHVENLEGLWEQGRRALRPGGSVLAQEFVGPDRFQWTDAQITACDHALATLVPDEHKVDHRRVERVPLETMISLDPSEAVRSSAILSTCAAAGFRIESYASAGGALLQPVLMYQVHTFEPRDWRHNLVLARLFAEEDRLMRDGVLNDDFAMFVAVPEG
jgi:SAM-dependent methyltransferase